MPLSRVHFQTLAEVRVTESAALLAKGHWDGAYYLAGYAVECALKACIMAYVERTGIIFEDRKYSEKCWTHDFETLMTLTGLEAQFYSEVARNLDLGLNWKSAIKWKETSRYARLTEAEARELHDAVTNQPHGVLTWIRQRW